MKFIYHILIVATFLSQHSYSQDWKTFPYQPAGSAISFPKDEGRHTTEPIEWWYNSGQLKGNNSGKTYSYMLTYFYYPASIYDGFRILNIIDDASGKVYEETRPLNYTTLSTTQLDIQAAVYNRATESWRNKVDGNGKLIPFEYTIKASSAVAELNLDCKSLKRPLLLGGDGYFDQGAEQYTYYYSQTSNAVSGKLKLNGITEDVTGTCWIDRQYGNFNPLTGEKYEWFQLQLSNGMDINLWNIFTVQNTIPNNEKYRILSAYVDESTQYTISDFTIERLAFNWMPDSVMCYSSKWRLTSSKNNLDLTITSKNNSSEITLPFRFFEGPTTISGTVNGQAVTGTGFAELLHSYEHPSLAITKPIGETFNTALPISWQLLNTDDGRPVTYDIEYSTDNKATFKPIAQGIKDTFYVWNNAPLSGGDNIWFKITANSIDGALKGAAVSTASSSVILGNAGSLHIKLFPNPVSSDLFLQPGLSLNSTQAKIIDVNGRIVRVIPGNLLSSKVDVRFLPTGIYFLKLYLPERSVVLKFIKK
ncbi:MAG: T9SS type A sorting domain-containing protein [Chitinophagaceae bacterium]|nr:T9SS type A sorting domain-containing protein [Chitinophagaceae bacterium]